MMTGKRARMFEEALQNEAFVEAARLHVESIQGPILLVSFLQDEVWPSTLMGNQLMKRLKDNHFPFQYEHVAFDTSHCNWSIEPCWRKILTFLKTSS